MWWARGLNDPKRSSVPVRPQLLAEHVVEGDTSNEEGGVQEELDDIERLLSRVDELARERE